MSVSAPCSPPAPWPRPGSPPSRGAMRPKDSPPWPTASTPGLPWTSMPTAPSGSALLELVDLVVEGLEADAQLPGGGGLVAVVLLQDDLDVLHLDVAQGGRALRDCEVGARRGSGRQRRGD